MEFSPELKNEFKKACKLSGFITFVMIGLILIQYRVNLLSQQSKRSLASVPFIEPGCGSSDGSDSTAMGISGRAVPPFERRNCAELTQ